MKTTRRHDIDWLRVIAIWLLVIYHIAIIFQPWATFFGFVRSEELFQTLWTPMSMLNVWRIPLLFYVSGMGVYFALRKRNWKALMQERAMRILIPFIFGFLAISPLHIFLFQKFYSIPLTYTPHAGHLWFLGNIFVYVLICSPLFFYLMKIKDSPMGKRFFTFVGSFWGPLCILLFFVLEVSLLNPARFEMYAQTSHGFFIGLLAFFFGFLFMVSGKAFWETILKWKWLYLGSAGMLYLLRITYFNLNAPNYLVAIESNLWIFGLLGLGYAWLNRPSKLLSYLSEAAYPIYIVHMFVLYGAALLILPLSLSVQMKFGLIVGLTFLLCYAIYEGVIKRIWFIRPLFGLKIEPKKESVEIESSVSIRSNI